HRLPRPDRRLRAAEDHPRAAPTDRRLGHHRGAAPPGGRTGHAHDAPRGDAARRGRHHDHPRGRQDPVRHLRTERRDLLTMPKFAYSAIDASGAEIEGTTKADTIGTARALLI